MDAVELTLNKFRIIVTFSGYILNFLSTIICFWSKELRGYPTFIFFGFMSIFASLAPLCFAIDSISEYVGTRISSYSNLFTMLMFYIGFIACESSSWILIAMTTERYLTMKIQRWRTLYFNSKRAIVTVAIIVAIFAVIYAPFLTYKQTSYSISNDSDLRNMFYKDPVVLLLLTTHSFLYTTIPVIALITMNSLLIYETVKTRGLVQSRKISSKRISITITVVLNTLFYILMNIPMIIFLSVTSPDFQQTQYTGRILMEVFTDLQEMFLSSLFLTLYVSSSLFRQQIKKFMKRLPNNEENKTTITK